MISAVCPEEIRAQNRKKKNKTDVWSTKRWKDAVKLWLPGKVCVWCGVPAQVAHHPTDESYGKNAYFDLSTCWAMCNTCHWMGRRGYVGICPVCKKHYIRSDQDVCRRCDPESREKAEKAEIKTILRRKAKKEADRRYYRKVKKIIDVNKVKKR